MFVVNLDKLPGRLSPTSTSCHVRRQLCFTMLPYLHSTLSLKLVLFEAALDQVDECDVVERDVLARDQLDGLLRDEAANKGAGCGDWRKGSSNAANQCRL